jgi:hypothetical protein
VGGLATFVFGCLRLAGILRVAEDVEDEGLDASEHGVDKKRQHVLTAAVEITHSSANSSGAAEELASGSGSGRGSSLDRGAKSKKAQLKAPRGKKSVEDV